MFKLLSFLTIVFSSSIVLASASGGPKQLESVQDFYGTEQYVECLEGFKCPGNAQNKTNTAYTNQISNLNKNSKFVYIPGKPIDIPIFENRCILVNKEVNRRYTYVSSNIMYYTSPKDFIEKSVIKSPFIDQNNLKACSYYESLILSFNIISPVPLMIGSSAYYLAQITSRDCFDALGIIEEKFVPLVDKQKIQNCR